MRASSPKWRIGILISTMLVLLVTWGLFHRQIQRSLTVRLLLNSANPSEEFFADSVKMADDPVAVLERCWATGKVVHRQLAATFLKSNPPGDLQSQSRVDSLLVACTADADASNRELGLAALEAAHSPRLFDAARAQLEDLDPLVRLSGLDYVRRSDAKKAAPVLIRSLDDPDLRIVAAAEVGLMRLSGEDYGVRARQAIPVHPDVGPAQLDPANVEAIRRGVEQRKLWWQTHQNDYDSVPGSSAPPSDAPVPALARPAAPDFALFDLQGHSVRLSNLKGKVVLLNFWATWCTACLAEIPDLVALQEKLGDQVVILGVALDGVPDEHGDIPGENNGEHEHKAGPSLTAVRAKVERAVKTRRINYPVLLDPKNSVGGQYNGGELPTTVIFDAEGRVRRRFIGERSLAVFQAMVTEASRPPVVPSPIR